MGHVLDPKRFGHLMEEYPIAYSEAQPFPDIAYKDKSSVALTSE
jgi:hypothetical protein